MQWNWYKRGKGFDRLFLIETLTVDRLLATKRQVRSYKMQVSLEKNTITCCFTTSCNNVALTTNSISAELQLGSIGHNGAEVFTC